MARPSISDRPMTVTERSTRFRERERRIRQAAQIVVDGHKDGLRLDELDPLVEDLRRALASTPARIP